jgi:cell wall-associated NlpC family hydrolase
MPRFTAEQIYAYARQAGFSPDQATTMTAIAMAESGGDSRSHATVGEDSQGLWQINALAHPDLAARFNLYDPAQNAQAAFIASHNGTDVSPWTTTHGSLSARYLRFKDEAQAAAAAYGDGPNHGVWTGTAGYGHPLSPGDPAGRGAAPGTATTEGSDAVNVGHGTPGALGVGAGTAGGVHIPGADYGIPLDTVPGTAYGIPMDAGLTGATAAPAAPGTAAPNDHLHTFLSSALAQNHDQYIFGVMDRLDDPDPKAFDCSMLVEWSAHQAGVDLPRNAWDQYRYLHEHGMVIPVDQAIHTPGALLFSFNSDPDGGHAPVHQHVAISLGDGKTIEALGTQYGVGSFDATPKRFQYAAVIPGISDHVGPVGALPEQPDQPGGIPVGWPYNTAAADPHPTPGDPGGVHITDAAPVGGVPTQFNDLLAVDPDHLDSSTAPPPPPPPVAPPPDPHPADPHPAPPAPQHEPLYFTLVDANGDGLDDSLQQAGGIPAAHPAHADDSWYHDHDHDHGHGSH